MNVLEQHERFEMEVLDGLRRARRLDPLVFGGGTMLRLCHQLPRYSADIDFFLKDPERNFGGSFQAMIEALRAMGCEITDEAEKRFSWLVEVRRTGAPRRLKIEIRKDGKQAEGREIGIAFSASVPGLQVRLAVCTLRQMWRNKVEALIDRQEIRDAYDLEFIMRRGAGEPKRVVRESLVKMQAALAGFSPRDFRSTLGNLLPPEERERLVGCRFVLLEGAIAQVLTE